MSVTFDILQLSLLVRPRGHRKENWIKMPFKFLGFLSLGLTTKLNFNISKTVYCIVTNSWKKLHDNCPEWQPLTGKSITTLSQTFEAFQSSCYALVTPPFYPFHPVTVVHQGSITYNFLRVTKEPAVPAINDLLRWLAIGVQGLQHWNDWRFALLKVVKQHENVCIRWQAALGSISNITHLTIKYDKKQTCYI